MAHGTNHPFLHIIIIIIIIIHIIIIFLYQAASTNPITYFPLNPMGICFFNTGQLLHVLSFHFIICLRVTATSFVISAHIDDYKAIQMQTRQSIKSIYCIINYPNLLNIFAGIPIAS